MLVLGIIDFMKRACKISFKWPLVVGTALALVWGQATSASAADELTLDTAQAKAAKSDAPAEYFLGKLYERGKGVTQDYAKAADYLRQAADQGYAPAQTDLGALYAQGLGVKLDDQQAAAWYRKAADNGDPLAQYAMGLFYSEARGVPGDPGILEVVSRGGRAQPTGCAAGFGRYLREWPQRYGDQCQGGGGLA